MEGGLSMAMAIKPNEANIIRSGQLKAFAELAKSSIPNKAYWDECKKASSFTESEIKKLKELRDS